MLALLLAAQVSPGGPIFSNPALDDDGPLFEFAPSSGVGMGPACACAAVTGGRGEAITFTRGSSATCLKGGALTGIATGDLVTCSSDQPRVQPGADGAAGLMVEGGRTNVALRSEAFDNAAWTKATSGVVVPVVTADQAVAPDGATTAERVVFAATSGAQYSVLTQSPTISSSRYTGSVFVRGVSGSGSIHLSCHTGSADNCVTCNYNATTTTRCVCTSALATTTPIFIVGNYGTFCGSGSMPAADVYLWGAQIEAGTFVSSYVATAGSTVARSADAASVSLTLSSTTISLAATWAAPAALASQVALHAYVDANNSTKLSIASSKVRGTYRIGGSDSTQDTAGNATVSASNALATYYDLTNKAACLGGTCTAASATLTLPTGSHTLYVGADQAGANHAFGVLSKVCVDSSATRCR